MELLDLKKQNELKDLFLKERLNDLLPSFMKECGIDMWIVPSLEYNEDPILEFLTPTSFPTARRLTILVLVLENGKVKRYCVNRHYPELEEYYDNVWDESQSTQWQAVEKLIQQSKPKTIGLNISKDFAYCDGLSKSMYDEMEKHLSEASVKRFVSAEYLGVRFLETRTKSEKAWYPKILDLALSIVGEAFSNKVITPNVTTTTEVEWWMKNKVNKLGLTYWFPPDVNLQRKGEKDPQKTDVIKPGDLLHCDFGITYLGLCSDTQRNAYVAQDGEIMVPQALMEAFKVNNKFQDIVRSNFVKGRSGNEIFTKSIKEAKANGIKPLLYSHPCGTHGHAAGPTIGLFNQQEEIPIQGDVLLNDDTAYALELNNRIDYLPWNQEIYLFSEETVLFTNGKVEFLTKGRDQIYFIK
ncbi:MAG: M24 family metallopeptidase [Erysipelotrichaceae bacterium]